MGVVQRVGTQSFQSAYLQEVVTASFSGAGSSASFSVWSLLVLDPLTSDVGSQAPPLFSLWNTAYSYCRFPSPGHAEAASTPPSFLKEYIYSGNDTV